jgi:hypothetical protein
MLMIDSPRGWVSLFLGFVVFAFGLIPFLSHINVIKFQLPFTLGGIILPIILIVGSLLLFFDSVHQDIMRTPMIVIGFILLVLGVIPLLASLNVIPNDFTLTFLKGIFRDIVLMVTGIMLMLGAGD